MSLGDLTQVIFYCYSLESLQRIEDYVLKYVEDYSDAEMKCVYTMLEVRNKILFQENIVRRKIYKD